MSQKLARVYVMRTNKPGVIKVGMSLNPKWREWEFSGIGARIVYQSKPHANARAIERRAHALLCSWRVGNGREMFKVSQKQAIAAVEEALKKELAGAPLPEADTHAVSFRLDRETFLLVNDLRMVYRNDGKKNAILSQADTIRRAIRQEATRLNSEIEASYAKIGVARR